MKKDAATVLATTCLLVALAPRICADDQGGMESEERLDSMTGVNDSSAAASIFDGSTHYDHVRL